MAGGPDWLRKQRLLATEALSILSWPSEGEEIWRYSRINDFPRDTFNPAPPPTAHTSIPGALADLIAAVGERAALVATLDGSLVHSEVDDAVQAKGLLVQGSDTWTDGRGFGSIAKPIDVFAAANSAYTQSPILIDIPAGLVVEQPIVVAHHVASDNAAVFPRLVIRAGANSQAKVVEILVSDDVDAVVAPVTEIIVGDGANLDYANIQQLGHRVWQVGYQVSEVGRDATFRSTSASLGGYYARVRTDSRMLGQGGNAYLNAVYFGSEAQMHDFRTLQEHIAPKTTSDLLFKGAVADTAQSVYSGLIRVRKGAAGTNAFQTNRNLVLSQGAHADSVPNLEIDEQDVRCSHASAVGPVDEEQRYYLESRGVPSDIAERLIVLGFLDDILKSAGLPGLAKHLRHAMAEKLDRADVTAVSS